MFRSPFLFLLSVLFSFNVFAIAPRPDELFHRLGLTDSFLRGPMCSVKRKGVALICDFDTLKNDPAIQSGKVTFLNNTHNGEGDHGNAVAEVTSRFLPKGRTYLKEVGKFEDTIRDDLLGNHFINDSPVLALNYSIDLTPDNEQAAEKIEKKAREVAKAIAHVLNKKILVLAAGNNSESAGGQEQVKTFFFSKLLSMLTPQQRKNIVLVGATCRSGNREVLDARYSNVAGKHADQFILAPSGFSAYSPQEKRHERHFGTSTAAPVITGLLTRALLANPRLKPGEAVQLLFQTANKRGLVSTGDVALNKSLYGNGIVDAPLFFRAAHDFNAARTQGKPPQASLTHLLKNPQPNVFRDFKKNLRDKLDVMNLLDDYEDYKSHIQRIAKQGHMGLENHPSSMFSLDDFDSCSEIFKAQKLPDHQFTQFALSKFPLSSLAKEHGGSILTAALLAQRKDLTNHLLNNKFNIHFRGKNSLGDAGPLPIHAAALVGNDVYVKKLIQKGISINDRVNPTFFPFFVDSLVCTIFGFSNHPHVSQRLNILDMLYHQGADFHQMLGNYSLVELTEEGLGAKSPITKRVKYYAKNSGIIQRKPILIETQTQKAAPKKPNLLKEPVKLTKKTVVSKTPQNPVGKEKAAARKAKLTKKAAARKAILVKKAAKKKAKTKKKHTKKKA